MNKKEFYKEIKNAIVLSVNRFYTDLDFDGHEELRKKTIRSLLYEYKRDYPFEEQRL